MRCDAMRGVVRYVVRCVNEAMMMVLSVWVANEAEKPWPYIDVSRGETTFIRRLELRVKYKYVPWRDGGEHAWGTL